MAVTSTGNASLEAISNAYQSSQKEKIKREEALGKESFLTMLVAQLQNQDPLNPMDGTDFSAQLAQFSQLEQLMNLNESMNKLAKSFTTDSDKDWVSYIGKQVSGQVDSMEVADGGVSGGFFNLSAPAEVMVNITDASGKTIKSFNQGSKAAGSHLIPWDGTDAAGKAVADGTYTYTVLANAGNGYRELPTQVTGRVEGIAYNNKKPYLMVQGVLVDPNSLTSVIDPEKAGQSVDSVMGYLGKTISSQRPLISVEQGVLSDRELTFHLEKQEPATVKIYDSGNNLVAKIKVEAASAVQGENKLNWNGIADTGYPVGDGLYYYTVETGSGTATTPVSGEVSGIKYANGSQYLVLRDTGRLVGLSSITAIN